MGVSINDNFIINSPKVIDDRYSINGVTPYASVAAANAAIPITRRAIGLTVNIMNVEYWYELGITDSDLVIKSGGSSTFSLPKSRQVYLVHAADVASLGGAANRAYSTSQAAYNAANALQLSLGGTQSVVIMVGVNNSVAVGDITLTADWNKYVYVVGVDPNLSFIGDIIATSSTNGVNGFDVGVNDGGTIYPLLFKNVTVGSITTVYSGSMTGVERSGNVTILVDNASIGSIDSSITDVGDTGSAPGIVAVNWDPIGGGPIGIPFNTGYVQAITATGNTATFAQAYIANLAFCGDTNVANDVDNHPGVLAISNVQQINGNLSSNDINIIRLGLLTGNITAFSLGIGNCGKLDGSITIGNSDVNLDIRDVDYIGSIDLSNIQTTSNPILFKDVHYIGSMTLVNTNGVAGVTHPVVITNATVDSITMTNTILGNTPLVTKNCDFTTNTFTKVIHKNISSNGMVLNLYGVTAATDTTIISGAAVGIDNMSKSLNSVSIINTTANAVTGGIKIGTISGGTQVMNGFAVGANANLYTNLAADILTRNFTTNPTSLFIAAVTSFNSSNLNIALSFSSMK